MTIRPIILCSLGASFVTVYSLTHMALLNLGPDWRLTPIILLTVSASIVTGYTGKHMACSILDLTDVLTPIILLTVCASCVTVYVGTYMGPLILGPDWRFSSAGIQPGAKPKSDHHGHCKHFSFLFAGPGQSSC